jgi:hypothetical protein
MTSDDELEREERFDSIKTIIPSLPSLVIKFGGIFFKIKHDANKAGRIFQQELIDQGIDKTVASKLKNLYLETSNVANYFKFFKK